MGKQVSAVTTSMSLYTTIPNVHFGTSQSLVNVYNLNRAVLVTNLLYLRGVNNNTINKSTGLLKNGFINKIGDGALMVNSIKILKLN